MKATAQHWSEGGRVFNNAPQQVMTSHTQKFAFTFSSLFPYVIHAGLIQQQHHLQNSNHYDHQLFKLSTKNNKCISPLWGSAHNNLCRCGREWSYFSHQISEIVTVLAGHEPARVAEASDVLDVGLQPGRVCFQHYVDEGREEVVSRRSLLLADFDGVEDVLAAASDARQLFLGHALGIHFNHIWKDAVI